MTQETLIEEPDAAEPTSQSATVELRARHDVVLTTRALEHELAKLRSVAKAMRDAGYLRESRIISGDVAAIQHDILPQFGEQRELPLVAQRTVRDGIAEALRGTVHKTLAQLTVTGEFDSEAAQRRALNERQEQLLDALGARIGDYVLQVAETAYSAGYSARDTDPEAMALRALQTLATASSGE